MNRIEFGCKVQDRFTGFVGVVTGYSEYVTGCRYHLVEAQAKGGKAESDWIDVSRLRLVEPEPVVPPPANVNGGPALNAPPKG